MVRQRTSTGTLYKKLWRRRSRPLGRPKKSTQIRDLIRRNEQNDAYRHLLFSAVHSAQGLEGSTMINRKKRQSETGTPKYEPAVRQRPPPPRILQNGSQYYPNRDQDLQRLKEAFRSEDRDFVNDLASQLIHAGSNLNGGDGMSFMIHVIKGVKQNDQLEAMLAAQMAAIHMLTMKFVRDLATAETSEQYDIFERGLNKLTRTFTTQMETLKRYRTGGEQKVTVRHVSVNDGGQAIVGNVTQAANALDKPAKHIPTLTDARQTPMEIVGEPEHAPIPLRGKQEDDGQSFP
jgi:hypothetical protein